jgi:serine protease DegS/serine protease DegQ
MGRFVRALAFVLQFATVGLAIAFVATRMWPERFTTATPAVAPAGPDSYRDAVRRAAPSVVNIYSNRVVTDFGIQLLGDPMAQRPPVAYATPIGQRSVRSDGSGVLVSADGLVLTNDHVVRDAQRIWVGLPDGRVTEAQVAGRDPATDLALLRIQGSNFQAMAFAAEDRPEVGDVVLAIGNPEGIGQTVTIGIISATGRDLPALSRYEDLVQTDAAINFGNSGGALVNARGELVGVITGVVGRDRGVQGVSFAIPAASAQRVLAQLVERGYVVRGTIGAEYAEAPVSAAPTREAGPRGVQLVAVAPGGPADAAGLRVGDRLLRFGGLDIDGESDLRTREAATAPGTRVSVEAQRSGVPVVVQLEVAERPRPGG